MTHFFFSNNRGVPSTVLPDLSYIIFRFFLWLGDGREQCIKICKEKISLQIEGLMNMNAIRLQLLATEPPLESCKLRQPSETLNTIGRKKIKIGWLNFNSFLKYVIIESRA